MPDSFIDRVFGVMWACLYGRNEQDGHIFQVLTKRADRMRDYMRADRREAWATAAVHHGGGIDPDGIPIPYESISGDWSQSNFSSSRMGQHEYRDSYTALQQWFIRSFRKVLHAEWLQSAVLAGAIPAIDRVAYALNPQKFEAATFKPRGWSYINPKDDIAAAKEAIKAGLSTRTHEIARYGNGLDVEDIDTVRRQELDQAAEKDLAFDTDPEAYAQKPTEVAPPAEEEEVDPPEAATDTARVVPLRSNA